MNLVNLKSILESMLFSVGEPMFVEKIAKTLKKDSNLIKEILKELTKDYEQENRGLRIIIKENRIQMVSSPKNSKYIEKLIKQDLQKELTSASLETLAIVAYKEPITRAEIDEIRGVNSSFMLRNLLIRGLIERRENPKDARSYVYEMSFNFLKKLGLKSKKELPEYKKLSNQL